VVIGMPLDYQPIPVEVPRPANTAAYAKTAKK